MRLTTLSRKLGITRDELIQFLISRHIKVPEGVNAKISEEEAAMVLEHFTPEPLVDETPEEEAEESVEKDVEVLESEVDLEIEGPDTEEESEEEKSLSLIHI